MDGLAPQAAVIGAVTLLERSINYLLGNLQLARPELLDRPTPCTDWDLRELLWHVNDGLDTLSPGSLTTEDPIHAVRDGARRALGSWASARSSDSIWIDDVHVSPAIVATAGAIELAGHGWDIARACGWRRPVPPGLADELLELLPVFVTSDDRRSHFGPPVEVPACACSGDRLIGLLGRRPPGPVERRYLQSRAALLLASPR